MAAVRLKTMCGVVLALALTGGCSTAENIAASFVPTQHQVYDASGLKSGTYRLDPEHASLHFSFIHMGFSESVVRFNVFDATLDFDKNHPEAARLEVTIDLSSVDTNLPEFDEILRGKEYFDVEKFPQATFVSESVSFTGERTGEIQGTLTVHGVSRPATLSVTFNGGEANWVSGKYTLGFAAEATVMRSDFGMKNLLSLASDEIRIEIHAEFQLEETG